MSKMEFEDVLRAGVFTMKKDNFEAYLDLRREDIDVEVFGAALTVQHIRTLIAHGGSTYHRPDQDDSLHPHHFQVFLERAVAFARRNKRFEHEWQKLQRLLPSVKAAWEKGQQLFQESFTRATNNEEEMEYLSQIDFALDSYAYVAATNTYPDNRALQAWVINGYMLAWRQHYFSSDE